MQAKIFISLVSLFQNYWRVEYIFLTVKPNLIFKAPISCFSYIFY